MNIHGGSTITTQRADRHDKGFTLIEILIAIVLIGVLSAVAVVGIGNMLDTGSTSACKASKDASQAATAVYFAGHGNAYPADFTDLTVDATGPALTLPDGALLSGADLIATSGSWTLTMDPANSPPTFVCGVVAP